MALLEICQFFYSKGMKRFPIRFCFLMAALCFLCMFSGCGSGNSREIRIGIDNNWYPQNFQDKQFYVNGFVDELLLEISRHSGMTFRRVSANWDSLFEGLKRKRYDSVLSSLPLYSFNAAKYDFSQNFLDIGPVLVTPAGSTVVHLDEMSNKVVGMAGSNQEQLLLQKYPNVITRTYDVASELFDAAVNHNVEGIVVDRLIAVGYVKGSYAQKLKIAASPLNDLGLHLVALKGDPSGAVKVFNKSLQYLIKKKKLQKLLKKWQLDV
jgi:ABC-type amino acid transport substrate-binding protein